MIMMMIIYQELSLNPEEILKLVVQLHLLEIHIKIISNNILQKEMINLVVVQIDMAIIILFKTIEVLFLLLALNKQPNTLLRNLQTILLRFIKKKCRKLILSERN